MILQQHVHDIIKTSAADHGDLVGERLIALRALAGEVAQINAHVAELVELDRRMALFCNDLRECLDREQSLVFPILLRLREQTAISSCKAGAIKARLHFMTREQDALLESLDAIITVVQRHRSPDGPCEACHKLLAALIPFRSALRLHIRREQDELFTWAIERERELSGTR